MCLATAIALEDVKVHRELAGVVPEGVPERVPAGCRDVHRRPAGVRRIGRRRTGVLRERPAAERICAGVNEEPSEKR